ncbi:hypothetical protein GDO86_006845 [Hymenochirus boettgeri]|uniref:Uncharacterized protein n=1 Tax=Hymenochirus boettgeri TaxID=247094 RepID=A0A8T2JA84_9PIPI|nr:hypothetical protein GDO86_006845 [Hymenochirus boettgeri]
MILTSNFLFLQKMDSSDSAQKKGITAKKSMASKSAEAKGIKTGLPTQSTKGTTNTARPLASRTPGNGSKPEPSKQSGGLKHSSTAKTSLGR